MKYILILLVAVLLVGCDTKPTNRTIYLTDNQAKSALSSIKKELSGRYSVRIEIDRGVVMYVYFEEHQRSELEQELSKNIIVIKNTPMHGNTQENYGSSGSSGGLKFGSGGLGQDIGGGFQRNLSDGHISPSWN